MTNQQPTTPNHSDELHEALLRRRHQAPDVNREWERMRLLMEEEAVDSDADIEADDAYTDRRPGLLGRVRTWWMIAAAVVIALVVLRPWQKTNQAEQDAEPRREGVIISQKTEDNRVRVEQDGRTTHPEDNRIALRQSAKPSTVTTPRGRDCHLTLPDGTRVWLNADTRLTLTADFASGKKRHVELQGEASFDVVHNEKRPFVVSTPSMTATVLGTTFHISAYGETPSTVTLITGSLRVAAAGAPASAALLLRPGQQAALSAQGLEAREVDTYPITQRSQGFFYFHEATLLDVMKEIGRWYNCTIVFENEKHLSTRIHFVAERCQGLTEIVSMLNDLDGVEVRLAGGEITVM